MDKKELRILLVTSLLCLLPFLFGIAVYSKLPSTIGIHFSSTGAVNNTMPKAVVVFGFPIFLMLINIASKLRLFQSPIKNSYTPAMKVFSIVSIPIISIGVIPLMLLIALGIQIPIA